MKTIVSDERIDLCAEILQNGGLVGVPTETVYGLSANGLDPAAVEKLYEVKGRPAVKPLSLMVSGPEAMDRLCLDIPSAAKELARRFWPGPLTIVLKAKEMIPPIVRAGGITIGLRCPDHPLTLALLRSVGFPLAAPSANPTDLPSPKTAREVLAYFDGRIEAVLDGGPCGIGLESTVLSLAEAPYRILRQGAMSDKDIADALVAGMTVFGITGGSGSGKTTALHVLRELGALLIDADAVYHELLRSDVSLLQAIEARFPGTVRNGILDRKRLAETVFGDPESLSDLNGLTHPAVIAESHRRLREHAMRGGSCAAVDAIALIGSGLETLCDKTFAVVAPREERIRRIMARDGIDRTEAVRRIDAQPSDVFFVSHCSAVLHNDSTEKAFSSLCKKVFLEEMNNG